MIVHKISCAVTYLKDAYHSGEEYLILDLDESLNSWDVPYAWVKCERCGEEASVTLGISIPKECLCGGTLCGFTADMVVKGCIVLYNYGREHQEEVTGDPCDDCFYMRDQFGDCLGEEG